MSKTASAFGVAGQGGAYLAQIFTTKGCKVIGTPSSWKVSPFLNLEKIGINSSVTLTSMLLNDFRKFCSRLIIYSASRSYGEYFSRCAKFIGSSMLCK